MTVTNTSYKHNREKSKFQYNQRLGCIVNLLLVRHQYITSSCKYTQLYSARVWMANFRAAVCNDTSIHNFATEVQMDPSHKSYTTLYIYPTMHRFVTEMCISITKWYIVRYRTGVWWDLSNTSIVLAHCPTVYRQYVNYRRQRWFTNWLVTSIMMSSYDSSWRIAN